jgi:NhaA family Na+:H+ antiporter
MVLSAIREFLRAESAGGVLLLFAALAAMVFANTPLDVFYDRFLETEIELRYGQFHITKPTLLWINDGLMAVFFFLVGLELKREILEGELSNVRQVALPALGAVGGMAAPALFYAAVNWHDSVAINGWAIPAATDIAFALGVLTLLGDRVPVSLKVFLVTLAVLDDLGAIVIIALFYTAQLSVSALVAAAACLVILAILNVRGVVSIAAYLLVGLVLWTSVLKSGVHATLAGVALAFTIPMHDPKTGKSPLHTLEHDLHPPIAYGILPIFAFANAGVTFEGMSLRSLIEPIPLGIAGGLFVGKQIGILAFAWLCVRLGLATLPTGVRWRHLHGVALLCGIGFTMSLFVSSLAFEHSGQEYSAYTRLGIISGSVLSALAGYLVLRVTLPAPVVARTPSP